MGVIVRFGDSKADFRCFHKRNHLQQCERLQNDKDRLIRKPIFRQRDGSVQDQEVGNHESGQYGGPRRNPYKQVEAG